MHARRIDGRELLLVAALDPFIVDEEANWLCVFRAVGSG